MKSTTKTEKEAQFETHIAANAYRQKHYASHGMPVVYVKEDVERAFVAGADWARAQVEVAPRAFEVHALDTITKHVTAEVGSLRALMRSAQAAIEEVNHRAACIEGAIDDLQLDQRSTHRLIESVHGLVGPEDPAPEMDYSNQRDFDPGAVLYDEADVMGDQPGVTKIGISRKAFDHYVKAVNAAYAEDEKTPKLQPYQRYLLDILQGGSPIDQTICEHMHEFGAAFIAIMPDGTRKVFDPRDVIIQVKASS